MRFLLSFRLTPYALHPLFFAFCFKPSALSFLPYTFLALLSAFRFKL
jgi:hypothetical protein